MRKNRRADELFIQHNSRVNSGKFITFALFLTIQPSAWMLTKSFRKYKLLRLTMKLKPTEKWKRTKRRKKLAKVPDKNRFEQNSWRCIYLQILIYKCRWASDYKLSSKFNYKSLITQPQSRLNHYPTRESLKTGLSVCVSIPNMVTTFKVESQTWSELY